jgi:hypothetical protein
VASVLLLWVVAAGSKLVVLELVDVLMVGRVATSCGGRVVIIANGSRHVGKER